MKNNNFEFVETSGLYYWREKKEESFLKALLAGFLLMVGLGLIFLIGIGIDNK